MRRAAQVDPNQGEIVDALRKHGASVQLLNCVGAGCPDLLVGYHGLNYLMEVKFDDGKLNDKQVKWHGEWKGQKVIVRTPEQAIDVLEQKR